MAGWMNAWLNRLVDRERADRVGGFDRWIGELKDGFRSSSNAAVANF